MKRVFLLSLTLVMILSLAACGEDAATLAEITVDQGLTMQIPSDLTLQDQQTATVYLNEQTSDNIVISAIPSDQTLDMWSQDSITASYEGKNTEVTVVSYESGLQINGVSAVKCSLTMKTASGTAVAVTVVVLSDGITDHIVTFTTKTENTDSSITKNLQTCIDSITVAVG